MTRRQGFKWSTVCTPLFFYLHLCIGNPIRPSIHACFQSSNAITYLDSVYFSQFHVRSQSSTRVSKVPRVFSQFHACFQSSHVFLKFHSCFQSSMRGFRIPLVFLQFHACFQSFTRVAIVSLCSLLVRIHSSSRSGRIPNVQPTSTSNCVVAVLIEGTVRVN